jgi:hypothetical protein
MTRRVDLQTSTVDGAAAWESDVEPDVGAMPTSRHVRRFDALLVLGEATRGPRSPEMQAFLDRPTPPTR